MPFTTFSPDTFTKFMPLPDTVTSLAQDAVSASTESTRASFKAKDQVALSVETGKKMSEVASFEDVLTLQTNFVKSAVEANIKTFSELSEVYTDTLREAFAPLAKQAKKAAKTAS